MSKWKLSKYEVVKEIKNNILILENGKEIDTRLVIGIECNNDIGIMKVKYYLDERVLNDIKLIEKIIDERKILQSKS